MRKLIIERITMEEKKIKGKQKVKSVKKKEPNKIKNETTKP